MQRLNIRHIIKESIHGALLKEASRDSLLQYFKWEYSTSTIDEVIRLDKTPRLKFAEWLLKTSLNFPQPDHEVYNILDNDLLFQMVEEYNKGTFQPFHYSNFYEAAEAFDEFMLRLEKKRNAKSPMLPVFSNANFEVYTPESPDQLRSFLITTMGIEPSKITWCVACSRRDEYWETYTDCGQSTVYIIKNKHTNDLYIWNDSEMWSDVFNNWNDKPVKPSEVLDEETIEWLDENSCAENSLYDL